MIMLIKSFVHRYRAKKYIRNWQKNVLKGLSLLSRRPVIFTKEQKEEILKISKGENNS